LDDPEDPGGLERHVSLGALSAAGQQE
jgi:hypothetical protein